MATKTSATRKSRTSRKRPLPVFKSIRKPVAPPGHPISHAKPEEKARPAGRKAKHKQTPEQIAELEET